MGTADGDTEVTIVGEDWLLVYIDGADGDATADAISEAGGADTWESSAVTLSTRPLGSFFR